MDELSNLLWSVEAGLWNVNLRLTVREEHVDLTTLNGLAVGVWVEDVADLLTIAKGSVWHSDVLVVVRVGRGDEEFASLEGVEVVSDISLLVRMVPNRHGLSGLVDGC